jgi:1-acyl-sn-glycerol-3-phosphate acyltransferase
MVQKDELDGAQHRGHAGTGPTACDGLRKRADETQLPSTAPVDKAVNSLRASALSAWPFTHFLNLPQFRAQGSAGTITAMHRTIFTTPVVSTVLRGVSLAWLKLAGWTVQGGLPPEARKSVFIAAPHTSNWDLPYTLFASFALRLTPYWMGKASIFKFPFGGLMRWLGGIPVDRSQSNNLVAASAAALQAADGPVQLIVPPEGTRSKTIYWKTGFYWIAVTAKLPIVMAHMDYPRKLVGLGPLFVPTGDVDADMAEIKRYYAQFKGRNSDQFTHE